ncbi:thiamine-phosphate kinase [Fimbriiglobus ruber]|uniref:Thiamine-monophosphate kinase n=1 Tax=Fimbriiglobus ruber TaxID=1908690 RepID=A0A225DKN2_9BACT|nr:thiamine-phosphate kinase [Fimbriiglobus ruber]OWK37739.1 Thiamine-monophosphate kinase [Fimbriiglobus ruber]
MSAGEFDYIRWIRGRTPGDPRVLVGPGDDCAVLAPRAAATLVTTDMLMDGVDFILADVGPRAAGRKAMAVNLSDIAAMAGAPTAVVVSAALPQVSPAARGEEGRTLAEEVFHGLREIADRFDVPIVGGDTNTWAGPLVLSVTVLGEVTGRGPALRSGARPGDWVFVTGPVGGSILGRHLAPTPRIAEGQALHRLVALTATIDISDGLTADLNHILEESRCGAVLSADSIPIHPDAMELARRTGRPPLAHALGDGEDFELVFTVSPADGAKLLREQPIAGLRLVKIGECVASGLWLEEGGSRQPLDPAGWVHAL